MEWLNYHHLFYFWTVVREGGVARASEKLRLAHPTVSSQLKTLEEALGQKLFTRVGRKLVLTEMGRTVNRYADEIFALGRELLDSVHDRNPGQPLRLDVGIADVVPKLVVREILHPARALAEPVRLVCREDKPDRLIAELALHVFDVVLTDAPVPAGSRVRAYSHLLGESGVSFFAAPKIAGPLRKGFPKSLDGSPMLLPTENTSLRRSLDAWFAKLGIRPRIMGEFEDSALLASFGAEGDAIFPAHDVIKQALERQHGVAMVGRVGGPRERFYAVSVERRIKHPAVAAITESARRSLFA